MDLGLLFHGRRVLALTAKWCLVFCSILCIGIDIFDGVRMISAKAHGVQCFRKLHWGSDHMRMSDDMITGLPIAEVVYGFDPYAGIWSKQKIAFM